MKEIFSRRSIRKYTNQEISDDIIQKVLFAGMNSPSAKNLRPYEFIVVRNSEMLRKLSETKPAAYMVKDSNVTIISLASETCDFWQQDMGASTQNILLEAKHYGIGTCWIGIREEQEILIRELLNIPEHLHVFNMISMGYPAEKKESNNFFEEARVHYERY